MILLNVTYSDEVKNKWLLLDSNKDSVRRLFLWVEDPTTQEVKEFIQNYENDITVVGSNGDVIAAFINHAGTDTVLTWYIEHLAIALDNKHHGFMFKDIVGILRIKPEYIHLDKGITVDFIDSVLETDYFDKVPDFPTELSKSTMDYIEYGMKSLNRLAEKL